MLNDKCQMMANNGKCQMSNEFKCQMSKNVKWQMAQDKCQITKVNSQLSGLSPSKVEFWNGVWFLGKLWNSQTFCPVKIARFGVEC